jgi:pyruvate/2-oxoglutarate dehydrogenase complex dihydrolipoamide acyltransferase (E2) component
VVADREDPEGRGERIEPRDCLSLTLSFDHDVIDGAPAARFAVRLAKLIESAAGLEQGR